MLNLCTKFIVLIHAVIWINKTYSEYVSRKYHTKANSYILQDEEEYYKWAYVKIDTVMTEVNT